MDLREAYLSQYFDEISPKDFYRSIFPKGELQEKGASGDNRYNAIAVEVQEQGQAHTLRYTITDDLDMIDELVKHENFILLSPISYVGKSRNAVNARYLYALAIDLDGVDRVEYLTDLFHQISVAELLPRPTYIVSSGNGIHLYYVFEKPIPCFKNITNQLAMLKHNLTRKLWNKYVTAQSKNVQYQSLFQGFRLVGGVTKDGRRTKAYCIGPKVSIEYLNEFVEEKNRLTEYVYKSSMTLPEAQKRYPEWYDKRIIKGTPKGTWTCKRDLYEWWLKRLYNEIVEGHRYYGVMCLAIYAKKCGIPKAELEADAFGLVKRLDSISSGESNRFTKADVLCALEMYNDNYITFPIESISQLTNLRIERNKRNGRKQKDHITVMNTMKNLKRQLGEKMEEGRPSAEPVIRAYLIEHPFAKKSEVIRETGLSKPTVYKYYESVLKSL